MRRNGIAGPKHATESKTMNTKLLTTAAIAVFLATGGAMAQTSGGASGGAMSGGTPATDIGDTAGQAGAPNYASDDEKMMYQENSEMLAPFFTDESMTTLKSDDEVKSAFEAMGAEDQSQMKSACERAMSKRGSYGSVTAGLCSQVGAM
jgi:hypothetical protein